MQKTRLEAFSDGVIAIIITIMVLEIKVPNGSEFADLQGLIPVFLSYMPSFIYLGIYWNNHHHMLHTITRVNGQILWANLHLLFWLSLVPFATGWIGQNNLSASPMAFYGVILLLAAIAYFILQGVIIKNEGKQSILAKAVGMDWKGKASIILYVIGIVSCLYNTFLAGSLYILVALLWLIPDKRIEKVYKEMTDL